MLEHRNQLLFFVFRNYDAEGRFHGELTNPIPVTTKPDGSLALET
jgi:hypothetical protein